MLLFCFAHPSHVGFLWQRDFENSSSPTAHCSSCRRRPTLDARLIHCSLSAHSPSCPGFPAWISDGGDCVGGWGWRLKPAYPCRDWLVGIHLIFWVYYRARPLCSAPSSRPSSFTTARCDRSRENISSAQGGED